MKLYLLLLGVSLAVCEENSVQWEQSSSYKYEVVDGKPVVKIDNKPLKVVRNPQQTETGVNQNDSKPEEQQVKIDPSKEEDPSKFRNFDYGFYPHYYYTHDFYPNRYPYPHRYPHIDPGFARPGFRQNRPIRPYDPRNADEDFKLRLE